MEHELKIDEVYLRAKLAGDKLFEIRCNDRGFQKGDTVIYSEWLDNEYTLYYFKITYVTGFKQRDNYVVFGESFIRKVV